MAEPVRVADKTDALAQTPTQPPPKKLFQFAKSMSPWEVMHLPDGTEVRFHVARDRRSGQSDSHGVFQTTDPKVAEEVRKLAKNPQSYISELT